MSSKNKPSDLKKRRRIRNLENKVQWGIKDGKLNEKLPKLKNLKNLIPDSGLKEFQSHVNHIICATQKRVAPFYLQFSGGFVALLIMILGAIAVSQDSAAAGVVLFILGLLLGGLGFWYRDQLIRRGWKKIAQELKIYFKECRTKYPGAGFEFHQQGHHSRTIRHGGKNKKNKKEQSMSVWYTRYIVIYLPGDQSLWVDKYVEDNRNTKQILASGSKPVEAHKEFVNDEPVVLPYWWAMAKARNGKVYYINNFKQTTQWSPPTLEQIEAEKEELHEILAPPDIDESLSDSEFDTTDDEDQEMDKPNNNDGNGGGDFVKGDPTSPVKEIAGEHDQEDAQDGIDHNGISINPDKMNVPGSSDLPPTPGRNGTPIRKSEPRRSNRRKKDNSNGYNNTGRSQSRGNRNGQSSEYRKARSQSRGHNGEGNRSKSNNGNNRPRNSRRRNGVDHSRGDMNAVNEQYNSNYASGGRSSSRRNNRRSKSNGSARRNGGNVEEY